MRLNNELKKKHLLLELIFKYALYKQFYIRRGICDRYIYEKEVCG